MERLNVADTVKVPWQAYTATGHPLLPDRGRMLATLVSDVRNGFDPTPVRVRRPAGDRSLTLHAMKTETPVGSRP